MRWMDIMTIFPPPKKRLYPSKEKERNIFCPHTRKIVITHSQAGKRPEVLAWTHPPYIGTDGWMLGVGMDEKIASFAKDFYEQKRDASD